MKALALFAAAILFAGCQENAVEPITVRGNEKAVPAVRTIQINERIEFKTPDGFVANALVTGEVTYNLIPLEQAGLTKEIPAEKKQMYDLKIAGKGEMVMGGLAPADVKGGLAKPEVWYFAGEMMKIVEDGTRGINVAFTINGARWLGHYHVAFIVARGTLVKGEDEIDFHPTNME
jgi:hypothetical protein